MAVGTIDTRAPCPRWQRFHSATGRSETRSRYPRLAAQEGSMAQTMRTWAGAPTIRSGGAGTATHTSRAHEEVKRRKKEISSVSQECARHYRKGRERSRVGAYISADEVSALPSAARTHTQTRPLATTLRYPFVHERSHVGAKLPCEERRGRGGKDNERDSGWRAGERRANRERETAMVIRRCFFSAPRLHTHIGDHLRETEAHHPSQGIRLNPRRLGQAGLPLNRERAASGLFPSFFIPPSHTCRTIGVTWTWVDSMP